MTENGKPFWLKLITFFLAIAILGSLWIAYYIFFMKQTDLASFHFWSVFAMIIIGIIVGDNISSLFKIFTLKAYLKSLVPYQLEGVACSAIAEKHLQLRKMSIESKKELDAIIKDYQTIEKIIEQNEKENKK